MSKYVVKMLSTNRLEYGGGYCKPLKRKKTKRNVLRLELKKKMKVRRLKLVNLFQRKVF